MLLTLMEYFEVLVKLFVVLVRRISTGYMLSTEEKLRVVDALKGLYSEFFSLYIPNESYASGYSIGS